MDKTRKIIHIDMDAYFVSIEERERPELKNLPLAVGGLASARGTISTSNYHARQFGVFSAMPTYKALQLCSHLIVLPVRMDFYRSISQEIFTICAQYADAMETISLDEAFLDVSSSESATLLAQKIRHEIFAATQLTASAGISYNKLLAKLASEMNKPNGQTTIVLSDGAKIMANLPVEKIYGIGRSTATKMHALEIFYGRDLLSYSLDDLVRHFGKFGDTLYKAVRGIDERPVIAERIRRSFGAEMTFLQDLFSAKEILRKLKPLSIQAFNSLLIQSKRPQTITVKLRFANFARATRSITLSAPLLSATECEPFLAELLQKFSLSQGVRLGGVTFSHLIQPKERFNFY